MNQFSGSKFLGKQRLALLAAIEKRNAEPTLLGRSRAERLIDDHLKDNAESTLSHTSALNSSLVTEESTTVRILGGRQARKRELLPIPNSVKKRRTGTDSESKGSSQSASEVNLESLIQVLSLLDHPRKFGRCVELLDRLFNSEYGKRLKSDFTECFSRKSPPLLLGSCSDASSADKCSQFCEEVPECWVFFIIGAKVFCHPEVTSNGDARGQIINLFERHIMKLMSGNFWDSSGLSAIGCGGGSELEIEWDGGAKRVRSCFKPNTNELSSIGEMSELLSTSLLGLFCLRCLYHNLLFTDDPMIFHKSTTIFKKVLSWTKLVPSSTCSDVKQEDDKKSIPPSLSIGDVEITSKKSLKWKLPSKDSVLLSLSDCLFQMLNTMYKSYSIHSWTRTEVEQIFNSVYSDIRCNQSIFQSHQIPQIQEYQRLIQQKKKTLEANSNNLPQPYDDIQSIASTTSAKDARETVVMAQSSTDAWSLRQIVNL